MCTVRNTETKCKLHNVTDFYKALKDPLSIVPDFTIKISLWKLKKKK